MKQVRATLAISKYSLIAMLKSPTSVVFSLLFPIIFITVFGAMIGDKAPVMKVAVQPGSDTANVLYRALSQTSALNLATGATAGEQTDALKKGRITAIISILADHPAPAPHYSLHITTASASPNAALLQMVLGKVVAELNASIFPGNQSVAAMTSAEMPGRAYHTIDFILPGQLGFSLLMSGIYGSSFLLFSMRQNLVLKRLRTAPVGKGAIIGGEMLSRLLFHIISFVLMVGLGYFVFGFTLVNGFATLAEMLVFSLPGLGIFMGVGFIISGTVHHENAISPIANTAVLPQILLCGLFFPVENYPPRLQHVCDVLPLTFFVTGLRKIAFEGSHIWQLPGELAGLAVWLLIIAPLSVLSFKWE